MRKQENNISCYTFQEIQVSLPINKSTLEPGHNSFMNCSVAMDVMAEPRSPADTDGPQSWKHLPPDPLPKHLLTPALLHRACEAFQDMDCPSSCHSREPLPQLCLWKSSYQSPSAARLWGGDITTKSQLWHTQTAQSSNGLASHTI